MPRVFFWEGSRWTTNNFESNQPLKITFYSLSSSLQKLCNLSDFSCLSFSYLLSFFLFVYTGDFYSLISKLLGEREDVVHVHKYNPTEKAESDLVAEIANVVQKKDLDWPDAREVSSNDERANAILVRDRIHKFHRLESTLRPPENRHLALQQPKHGGGNWEKERTGGGLGLFPTRCADGKFILFSLSQQDPKQCFFCHFQFWQMVSMFYFLCK